MATDFAGPLERYKKSIRNVVPLTREQERELAKRWKRGDKRAGDKLTVACLPFVISVALEYRRWGIPLEDIVQQGNIGLLRAVAKFDPDRECRLATYAVYWIRAEIREYVVRSYRVVRMGTTKAERRALRAYRTTHENDPEKLAAVSGLSVERATMLLPILQARETSLDATKADQGAPLERVVATTPSPEEEAGQNEADTLAGRVVELALFDLTEREQLIVRSRMMADEPVTLQALGVQLGVSKERVRQLEERTRAKLRKRITELEPELPQVA